MPDSLTDLQHARTTHAADRVSSWSGGSKSRLCKKVLGLPVLVRTMGAAPAVAMLNKGDTRSLAEDLAGWLVFHCPATPLGGSQARSGVADFIREFCKLDQSAAHAVDEEALRFAESLKLMSIAIHGT